jgi:hypothetical protein
MDFIFNDKAKKIIKESLKTSKALNEAYVGQEKKFNIVTDLMSDKNIDNHIQLYRDYIENFNKASAKLDSVDRSNVNSNHSEYRYLKLDETYNLNGTYLHEQYFANIGDNNSQINMDTLAYMRLNRGEGVS